jgi:hypothetical protein
MMNLYNWAVKGPTLLHLLSSFVIWIDLCGCLVHSSPLCFPQTSTNTKILVYTENNQHIIVSNLYSKISGSSNWKHVCSLV